ncbi:uncharacterized protein EDB93DRAFT_1254603 [Suillus bovinus]|uniref:uncharacterized protein n=1 Tax=Suillus bovinus TaxID=48563 RepID=UPI001B85B56A|nr:uncharacterized protein EDB93DRAFT_1254603 [Suillus bovinus]KAG2134171.1 hypothetical protein EDB93DRAFT_1254603 [Suillus bovinus]
MSSQPSNNALSVADASLCIALTRIKRDEADGWAVVEQAHDIARLVSQALQQHGRNALVILPSLLSAATEVWATMNVGQAPQWVRVRVDDSCMESHPFFPKTIGFVALMPVTVPHPPPTVTPPAPKVVSVPLIDSLPAEASKATTDKGKQPMVETLRQQCSVLNPSLPLPTMSHSHGSSATAMGMRYLNSVFGPLVAPNPPSVGGGQASASHPFSRPDVQGSTFTSGQPSSGSAQAGPSSAPAFQSHFNVTSPASDTHSLP